MQISERHPLAQQFEDTRGLHKSFTTSTRGSLQNILAEQGIEVFAFEDRTKSVASLEEKLHRSGKEGRYENLLDVIDICGIRVIAFLNEDCDQIESAIRAHFLIDEKNSVSKELELDVDRFGYQSTHLIISYLDDRLALPEFARFAGLKAEIQIKTVLQHAWAAIDWKFRYKSVVEAPRTVRRRLHRISALLDAADDEFSLVSTEISKIKKQYKNAVTDGDLSLSLDKDSLEAYLSAGPQIHLIEDLIRVINKFRLDHNFYNSTNYLLNILRALEIRSLNHIRSLLPSDLRPLAKRMADTYEAWRPGQAKSSKASGVLTIAILLSINPPVARVLAEDTSMSKSFKKEVMLAIG